MSIPTSSMAPKPVQLLSTLALQGVVEGISWASSGLDLRASFAPTKILMERLRNGEYADVVFLTRDGVLQLIDEGVLGSDYQDIATSSIGIAQFPGVPALDISTLAKLRDVLIDAESVAFSASGASGIFFVDLIRRLGIEDLIERKALISPDGFTGEFVANGKAQIAVQQLSELHAVSGLGAITPFPDEAQSRTVFSSAARVNSANGRTLAALLCPLRTEEGKNRLRSVGLAPV